MYKYRYTIIILIYPGFEGTLEPYMVTSETSSKFLDGIKGLHQIKITITIYIHTYIYIYRAVGVHLHRDEPPVQPREGGRGGSPVRRERPAVTTYPVV